MENSQLILLVIAGVIAFFLLSKVISTIFRVAIIAAVIMGGYWLFSGDSGSPLANSAEKLLENTTITELMNKHCADPSSTKCKCVVMPVYNDLTTRFSRAEIAEIESDKKRMATEMMNSFKAKKQEINACWGQKKDEAVGFFQKIKQVFSLFSGGNTAATSTTK